MKNILRSWLSRHSLNFKLNFGILTCVGLGYLGLAALISEQSAPIIKSQIENNAKISVEAYISDFTRIVTAAERVVLNAKNTLEQIDNNNIPSLRMVLYSALKTVDKSDLDIIDAWVYVFAPEDVSRGNLYLSKFYENQYIAFNIEEISNIYNKFPWFKEVPKKENIYWSEPYIDKGRNQIVVTCLVPFAFSNIDDFDGLMAITIGLSDIQSHVSDFSFYKSGKLLLLSKSGLFVTHPNPDIALKKTIFEEAKEINLPQLISVGKELQAGRSGHIHIPYSPLVNDAAILFYAPIKHIGWGVCLVYAQNEFLQPMQQFQFKILTSLLICIILLLALINRICHHSTIQLRTLGDIATQYGNGDFSKTFREIPSTSDIYRLASALSNMKFNLLNYIEQEREEATEKQKSQSELEIARNIQKAALSTQIPNHSSFDIATLMEPAKQVGGDFYDFFFVDDDKFTIVVADVSGKGIPAALYMMKAITLIKNISKGKLAPEVVFEHTNNQLYEGNEGCMFVTAFMAVIDLKTGDVNYVNAGHNPPLMGNGENYHFLAPKKNIALGIKKDAKFVAEHLRLQPNEHLFLYTDGVTEAENKSFKRYGEMKLKNILQKANATPQDNLQFVLKDIKKFTKGASQSDDITMLDFMYKGKNKHILDIEANVKKISDVLTFIRKEMKTHKIDEHIQFNVTMAAEEIFSNISLYAYKATDVARVQIATALEDDIYTIIFMDRGKKYNPLAQKQPNVNQELKERKIGGLGVFLAKKLSDEMAYRRQDEQNILTIRFKIKK